MDLKKSYFDKRNTYLESSKQLSANRSNNFASRELLTFEQLARISNVDTNFSWHDKSVLDLGSGDQFLKDKIQENGAHYDPLDYDRVDFNKDKFPFLDNTFDVVMSLAVIEHIANLDNYLFETYRVLKPGGIFYLSTPNFNFSYKTFYDDPTHLKPFTEAGIEKTLIFSSFINVSVFPGARCKSDWFYKGKLKFYKCAYLPFRQKKWFLPSFLCGRATSIFAICIKPKNLL